MQNPAARAPERAQPPARLSTAVPPPANNAQGIRLPATPLAQQNGNNGDDGVSGAQDLADRIGTLPPQSLSPGACGLFLWIRQVQARFIFFSHGFEGAARMQLDGETVDLTRVSASGVAFSGIYSDQQFTAGAYRIALQVEIEEREEVIAGAVIRRGLIRVQDGVGQSVVMPVGGLIGCQPSENQGNRSR